MGVRGYLIPGIVTAGGQKTGILHLRNQRYRRRGANIGNIKIADTRQHMQHRVVNAKITITLKSRRRDKTGPGHPPFGINERRKPLRRSERGVICIINKHTDENNWAKLQMAKTES